MSGNLPCTFQCDPFLTLFLGYCINLSRHQKAQHDFAYQQLEHVKVLRRDFGLFHECPPEEHFLTQQTLTFPAGTLLSCRNISTARCPARQCCNRIGYFTLHSSFPKFSWHFEMPWVDINSHRAIHQPIKTFPHQWIFQAGLSWMILTHQHDRHSSSFSHRYSLL